MNSSSDNNKILLNKKNYKTDLDDVNSIVFEYVKILHEYLTQ